MDIPPRLSEAERAFNNGKANERSKACALVKLALNSKVGASAYIDGLAFVMYRRNSGQRYGASSTCIVVTASNFRALLDEPRVFTSQKMI